MGDATSTGGRSPRLPRAVADAIGQYNAQQFGTARPLISLGRVRAEEASAERSGRAAPLAIDPCTIADIIIDTTACQVQLPCRDAPTVSLWSSRGVAWSLRPPERPGAVQVSLAVVPILRRLSRIAGLLWPGGRRRAARADFSGLAPYFRRSSDG